MNKRALVLLSGGLDSTTCLFWAKERFDHVTALTINYGQKHAIELECAARSASDYADAAITLNLDILKQIGDSGLVDSNINVNDRHRGNKNLPASFVPGRNIFFLTTAAAVAYKRDIDNIVIGANQVDYSGYPDCRIEFLNSMQETINQGLEKHIQILAPLLFLNKVEIIKEGERLGKFSYIMNETHSCYNGSRCKMEFGGHGCGICDSCRIRQEAYKEYHKGIK